MLETKPHKTEEQNLQEYLHVCIKDFQHLSFLRWKSGDTSALNPRVYKCGGQVYTTYTSDYGMSITPVDVVELEPFNNKLWEETS